MNTYHLRDNIYKPLSSLAWPERAAQLTVRPADADPTDVAHLAADLLETDRQLDHRQTELRELILIMALRQEYERDLLWPQRDRLRAAVHAAIAVVGAAKDDPAALPPAVRGAILDLRDSLAALKEGDADVPTAIVAG